MIRKIERTSFRSTAAALLLACTIGAAAFTGAEAATVSLNGPLFDVTYDDAGLRYQTGETSDPDTGSPIPVYSVLGGFTISGPTTIRYSLRPRDVFYDSSTGSAAITPGGQISVGGSSLSSDSAADAGSFQILPLAGNLVTSVRMLAVGSYDNPTESASLVYVEGVTANGDTGSSGGSLGIFSSGPLPSGATATFAAIDTPFGVDFTFDLSGVSSDAFATSSAGISYIDFEVTVTPLPPAAALLGAGVAALGLMARRRKG